MPIAPDPMTSSDFGISRRHHRLEIGPDQLAVRLDAGQRARPAPVAMMMCLAE